MPDCEQDADLPIRIPAHRPGMLHSSTDQWTRGKHVPAAYLSDRPVNRGNLRSLPDNPAHLRTGRL